jgi:hypothetical protein
MLLGVAPDTIARVRRTILATARHEADAEDTDAALCLDFDLAILGAEANEHDAYARAIRRVICPRAAGMLVALLVLTRPIPASADEIHDAARDGDLTKVKALLKSNRGPVSSKDPAVQKTIPASHPVIAFWTGGDTPLHLAARNGYEDVVALLLACKAPANARNRSGDTPLHDAVRKGHSDVVALLLPYEQA